MDQGFLRYLFESKNLSRQVVANIEASFGDADYETENKINDIIELLEECELNPNIYLLEYPGLLELAKIEDREELEKIIEYVKEYYKKNKKDKNPYLLIHLMLAAREIVKKEKDEETQKIIALLKREGLMKMFETKNNKSKDRVKVEQILHGDYEIIKRNINILKKEKTYKALVYSNPLILINPNEKEVRKLLEEYIKENSKEDEEQDKEKDEDKDKKDEDKEEEIEKEEEHEEDVEDDADEIDENVEVQEEENISGHPISQEEKRLLELGEEEKVLPILVCFNKYGISYDILKFNPEILRRHKIHNIPEIIELLYQNNIPFSVIYACPEILEKGKSDEIAQVIEELKTRGISLTIILTCPEILIKAEPERIREVCIEFEKNNIDKHLIYSMPSILISGDIENYIKNINGLDKEFKDDMQYVLDGLPDNYIIFPEMEDKVTKNIDEDNVVRVDMLSDENIHNLSEILIVKNVVSTKQVINTLNDEGIDIDIVNREPKILSQSRDRILGISKVVKGEKLGIAVINREPAVLVKTNIEKFKEILDVLKKYMPEQTKDVLKKLPSIIYRADAKNIEGVLKELKKNEINFEFVQKTPHILLREDAEEISKIITNLNQKGYTKQQIIDIPEILVLGREKYIDRNVKTFERNNLSIPLHLVYCISARNNEKNIDTLIENNLDRYIDSNPEILELKNSRLMQMIEISKQNNINVLKKVKDKETGKKKDVLNMEYFKANDMEIAKAFDLDIEYIEKIGRRTEKEENRLRRIQNIKLYNAVYPILEKQADIELAEKEVDGIAYMNKGMRISKQKVIRESYLDLEAKVARHGKDILKEIDTKEMMTRKLNLLSRYNIKKEKENTKIREGGRSERF